MWQSAAGIMTSQHRQSVIANNLANSETTGFKRDLVTTMQRRMGAQEMPEMKRYGDPLYDNLGGGQFVMPTEIDQTQGVLETSNKALDAAIVGTGFFMAEKNGEQFLTRSGNFTTDPGGMLVLPDGAHLLDTAGQPIRLDTSAMDSTAINETGGISQRNKVVAQLAIKKTNPKNLQKAGSSLFRIVDDKQVTDATDTRVQSEALEHSNVETAKEMVDLIESMRLLEANANMIKTQDQLLGRAVNDVGKIS